MKILKSQLAALLISTLISPAGFSQETATAIPTSVQTELVFDAAGPKQREAIKNIYLIACNLAPPSTGISAGSGFLIDRGVIVTNAHVVKACAEGTLVGLASDNSRIRFISAIRDDQRDLAILVPTNRLGGGLKLSPEREPLPGAEVSTWGYPFVYNGTTPLLSVGHVAGYRFDNSNGRPTKHIVVNGAFNHGNSGGPLMLAQDNSVIGVVVMTWHFYPAYVKQMIDQMAGPEGGGGWSYTLSITDSRGEVTKVSKYILQLTAMVLDEFYQKTQTMIGEAISASEVQTVIREKASEIDASLRRTR